MYSEKAAPCPETHLPKGPKPVFIRAEDIRNDDKKQTTGEEIFIGLGKVLDGTNIMGIQQIRRLWRIYLNSHTDRVKLISNGLPLRGASVPVYDMNPFTRSRDENLTRVVIKDIPLSLSDDVIRAKLQTMKYEMQGDIFRQKLRVNGQLTNCLNGDRVLYITPPTQPLPRKLLFGNTFMARVYHNGQPEHAGGGHVTCSRCLQSGHHVSRCQNEVACQVCKQTGHMRNECPANNQALRNNIATPDASMPRQGVNTRDESDSTQATETSTASSKTRQTRLADFVTKPSQRPRNDVNDINPAEVMDLRSPMRTRSSSRNADTPSGSANSRSSDGATDCPRSQTKMPESVIRDDDTPAVSDHEHGIQSGSASSDEDSTLSPETPPKTVTGNGRAPQKRKKKSIKKKK